MPDVPIGRKWELHYLIERPNADRCKSSQQKIGAALAEVCSKCEQYRCKNVGERSGVLFRNLSEMPKMGVFSERAT